MVLMLRLCFRHAFVLFGLTEIACSDSQTALSPEAGYERDASLAIPCDETGFALRLDELRTSTTYDWIELRVFRTTYGASHVFAQTGIACLRASTPDCLKKLAEVPTPSSQSCGDAMCRRISIATTRGEDVRHFQTHADLREFLGPVDSEAEALLLAFHAGYSWECGAPERSSLVHKDDQYELTTEMLKIEGTDCVVTTRLRVQVLIGVDATISELTSQVISETTVCQGQ